MKILKKKIVIKAIFFTLEDTMKRIKEIIEVKSIIEENEIVLLYFGNYGGCGVCEALKDKVDGFMNSYKDIKVIDVDIDESPALAASFEIFSVPAILLYVSGKEYIREARYISLDEFKKKLDRLLELK